MTSSPEYWIWLSAGLGPGYNANDLLDYFGSAKAVYDADPEEWIYSGKMKKTAATRLKNFSFNDACEIAVKCERNGWNVVTPEDEYYPPLLKDIYSYPLVLYVDGDCSVLQHQLPLAFVGTRNATENGMKIAREYAFSLSAAGFLPVSGGAMGIDTCSHLGALEAGKPTIAFLGCGFGTNYLMSNSDLRKKISECGALVTEFTPGYPAGKGTFPIRNRLIAGMSLGSIIVEAGLRSGSLITARNALEFGRDIFAFPGEITSPAHEGTNKLIADGAYCVTSKKSIATVYAADYPDLIDLAVLEAEANITSELPQSKPVAKKAAKQKSSAKNTPKKQSESTFDTSILSDDVSRQIYALLTDTPKSVDEIVLESKLNAPEVLIALTDIEICGGALKSSGNRYVRI